MIINPQYPLSKIRWNPFLRRTKSMNQLKEYVLKHLAVDLAEVRVRGQERSHLNEFEWTIIYKYTKDGYIDVNPLLRESRGKNITAFGKHLRACLEKLPSYHGLVYRGVSLTAQQFKLYKDHLKSGVPLMEYPFLSTSKQRLLAMNFGAPHLFILQSKNGKLVENYARFGAGNRFNESEVIFLNSSTFTVADISTENDRIVITMFEI